MNVKSNQLKGADAAILVLYQVELPDDDTLEQPGGAGCECVRLISFPEYFRRILQQRQSISS